MYKRLPPLNALKSFESAARHLSFTKAADELFVTQAAVSHQIKLLEDFLGVSLFIRKNRALALSEFGKVYFTDINKILRRLNEATERLLSLKTNPHLTISVPQTFGMQWLIPHLGEFNRLHPEIEVRIEGMNQDEGLLGKEIDIAVYYGKGQWENLQVDRLGEEDLLILGAPKLLEQSPIRRPEDLMAHTLIHTHNRDNWRAMAYHLGLEDPNIEQGPVFSHTFMALQAAVHGQGIVLANQLLAQQEISAGHLAIAYPEKMRDPKTFYVVNHLDRLDDKSIQAFRQWIMQTMKYKENE